jgi:hypothetical protein
MNLTVPLHDTPSLYFRSALSWAGLLGFDSEQELALHLQNSCGAIMEPSELLEIFSSVVKSDWTEQLIISIQ